MLHFFSFPLRIEYRPDHLVTSKEIISLQTAMIDSDFRIAHLLPKCFNILPWRERKSVCVILILVLTIVTFSSGVSYVSKYLAKTQMLHGDSDLDIHNKSRQLSGNGLVSKETASKNLSMYPQKDILKSSVNASHHMKLNKKYVVDHSKSQPQSPIAQQINRTNNSQDKLSYFRSKFSEAYAVLLWKTINVFNSVMTENNITYMMYGGTLIGSYRHHGLIPWDDDVDFLVPLAANDSVQQAFSRISHEYTINKDLKYFWKLYSVHADPINRYKWRWPFLDIFFFAENQTHIWDVTPWYAKWFCYPKTIIFPLRRRPFMNLTLPAPHNPRAVIETNYKIDRCNSGKWLHSVEGPVHEDKVPCSLLFSKFAFVQRAYMNGGCNETLVQNGEIVSYFFDEGQNC